MTTPNLNEILLNLIKKQTSRALDTILNEETLKQYIVHRYIETLLPYIDDIIDEIDWPMEKIKIQRQINNLNLLNKDNLLNKNKI